MENHVIAQTHAMDSIPKTAARARCLFMFSPDGRSCPPTVYYIPLDGFVM